MASIFSKYNIRGKIRTATGHSPADSVDGTGFSGTKALSKTDTPSTKYTGRGAAPATRANTVLGRLLGGGR